MRSQNLFVGEKDGLEADQHLERAFAALSREPIAPRPEYMARLRVALQSELVAQTARRKQLSWWQRWLATFISPGRHPAHVPQLRQGYGLRLAMAVISAMVILVLAAVWVMGLYPLGSGGQVAVLHVSAGKMQVARPLYLLIDTGLMRSITVESGEQTWLRPGDALVSDAMTAAEIAFPDGSKMNVGPSSQLRVEELQARTSSRPLVVAMHLERGEIRSQVERLRVGQDRFELRTPNVVAQVRGTVFRVEVHAQGTRVATDKGVVRVNYDGQIVDLEAGRELEVLLGSPPSAAQVRLQSPLLTPELPRRAMDLSPEGEQVFFTNTTEVSWRVQTLPGAELTFYVNDVAITSVRADDQGFAMLDFVAPAEGVYRVSAVMHMAGQTSLPSRAQILVIDLTPPPLVLTSPLEPQVTTSEVKIAGKTEPGVHLELNGRPVPVDETGAFEQVLTLVKGDNQLVYIATDRAGNSVRLMSVLVLE